MGKQAVGGARFVGTVVEGSVHVLRFRHAGQNLERSRLGALVIETGGERVTLEIAQKTRCLSWMKKEGPFERSATPAVLAALGDEAPAGHVEGTLEGFVIRVGDRLAALGTPVDHRLDEGGLRDAPDAKISRASVSHVAIGDDAEAALSGVAEPRPLAEPAPRPRATPQRDARPPALRGILPLLLFGIVGLVATLSLSETMPFAPRRAWLLVGGGLAFVALSSGLARALRAPGLTEFFPLPSGRGEKEPWRVPFWIDGAGLGWLVAFTYGVLDPRPSVCLVLFGVLCLHPLAHALATWRAERSFRVRAAALLRATTRGADVVVEGRIAGEGTQLSRGVLYVWQSTTTTHWTKDDKGNSVEQQRTTTFTVPRANANVPPELTLQSGERVTLAGGLLATDRRWFVPAGEGNAAHARTSVEGGDAVLLVGRRGEDGTLRAKGAETLLLFATPRPDARMRLRRLLMARRVTPWLLTAAMSALSIALGGFCPFGSRYAGTATLEDSACAYDLLLYYDTLDRPRGTLRLACDGAPLYGGFGMGQMDCTFAGSPRTPTFTCSDTDPLDGDLAVTLGTDGRLTVMDDRYATRAGRLERVAPVVYRSP